MQAAANTISNRPSEKYQEAQKPEEPSTLDVSQFLKKHNIGRTKFYSEVRAGELEIAKVGDKTLIFPDQERRWMKRKAKAGRLNSERSPTVRRKAKLAKAAQLTRT